MRVVLGVSLFLAACGGAKSTTTGRPEDVAKAAFEALKAGSLAPLEAFIVTADEEKRSTGAVLDDTTARERWEALVVQYHDRLNVDWDTATLGPLKAKYDPMGVGGTVRLLIESSAGKIAVDVVVTKVGRRFVFWDLKAGPGAETRQAAPDSEDDGG